MSIHFYTILQKCFHFKGTHFYLFLLLIGISSLNLKAQNGATLTISTAVAPSNNTYFARDHVSLTNGALITAESRVYIDPDLQLPVSYPNNPMEGFVNNLPNLDFTKDVGTILGESNVNLLGDFIHTIQIPIPKSVSNLTPSISLEYNSGNNTSFCGLGWMINGLQKITREEKDKYHNAFAEGVSNTNSDNFFLNGQMLYPSDISSNGINGTVYFLKNENFSTIISNSIGNPTFPESFQVTTKEGIIYEFGTNSNSKLIGLNGVVLEWHLTKVKDHLGNYYIFEYINEPGKEILIKNINYTGNTLTNNTPKNSLRFFYDQSSNQTNRYIGGFEIKNSTILNRIEIRVDQNLLCKYVFKYNKFFDKDYLILLEPVNFNNQKMNPYIFQYENLPQSMVVGNQGSINSLSNYYTALDINNDERTDIISQEYSTGYVAPGVVTETKQYMGNQTGIDFSITPNNISNTSNPGNYILFSGTQNNSTNGFNLAGGDFNGDGREDFLSVHLTTSYLTLIPVLNTNNGLNFCTSLAKQYLFDCQTNTGESIIPPTLGIKLLDFNGDAKTDIFVGFVNKVGSWTEKICEVWLDINSTVPKQIPITFNNPHFEKAYAANTESKTKQDLQGIYDFQIPLSNYYGLAYHENTDNFEFWQLPSFFSQSFTPNGTYVTYNYPPLNACSGKEINGNNDKLLLSDDFNGDGLSDIWVDNQIKFGKGNRQFEDGPLLELNFIQQDPGINFCTMNDFFSVDLNLDGKADIVEIKYTIVGSNTDFTILSLYYSTGVNFILETISIPFPMDWGNYEILFYDFNGDGTQDLIWFKKFQSNTTVFSCVLPKMNIPIKLSKLINGMGHITEVSYLQLNDGLMNPTINTNPQNTYLYPNSVGVSTALKVKSISIDNGIGGFNHYEYFNEFPLYNLLNQGLLGFEKRTLIDFSKSLKTKETYSLSPELLILFPSKIESTNTQTQILFNEILYSNNQITQIRANNTTNTFLLKQSKIEEKNFLSGSLIVTEKNIDNNGNLLYISQNAGTTCELEEQTFIYDIDPVHVFTVPFLLQKKSIKRSFAGQYIINEEEFVYNGNKQIIEQKINSNSSNLLVTKNFTYHPTGDVFMINTNLSNGTPTQEQYLLDPTNTYYSKYINPLGQIQTTVKNPIFDTPDQIHNQESGTRNFQYDGWGRITQIETNLYTKQFQYFWSNQSNINLPHPINLNSILFETKISTSGKPSISTSRDKLGRSVLIKTDGFEGAQIYMGFEYAANGQLIKETNKYSFSPNPISILLPITISYSYDPYQRLIQKTETDGLSAPRTTSMIYSYNSPNEVSETIFPDGLFKKITKNPIGQTTKVEEAHGNIDYIFGFSTNDNLSFKENNLGFRFEYDQTGNLTKKVTPIGNYDYLYNGLHQMLSAKDPKNNLYHFAFDEIGRMIEETGPEGVYAFEYVITGNGINKLKKISGPGNCETEFTYDFKGRQIVETFVQPGKIFTHQYQFDNFNNKTEIIYPNGFKVTQTFDNFGNVKEILNGTNQESIWICNNISTFGQPINYTFGNGLTTIINQSNFGFPISKETPGYEDETYNYDYLNGNLNSKTNLDNNVVETYQYNQDKLWNFENSSNPGVVLNTPSDNLGNILFKYGAGNFTYRPNGTIRQIQQLTNPFPNLFQEQDIEYTPFNKVSSISEITNGQTISLEINYGTRREKIKSTFKNNGQVFRTKYYSKNHEYIEKINSNNTTDIYEINYIEAPSGLCAIHVKENGTENLFYSLLDNQMSIKKLFSDNNVEFNLNFDPWGVERDPSSLQYTISQNIPEWLSKGYGGHEMLREFHLINMNGRMYDPIIGQMLSPDPILDENKYLDHNLFSYAYSNPIKYFDPSGWVEKHIPFGQYSEESFYQFDDATDGRYYQKVAEGNESENKGSSISREAADEMSEEEFLKTLEGNVFSPVVVSAQSRRDEELPTMSNNYSEAIGGSGVAFSATEKAAELSFGKANGIYKTFYVLGKATGALSVYNDLSNVVNKAYDPKVDVSFRDIGKLSTSTLFFISNSINPLIPAGYFLLDITGNNPWDWGN